MLTRLSHTFLFVTDQDEAIDFYVGKLGLEVHADAQMEQFRWLTLIVPGQPDHEIVVMVPGPPAYDADTAALLLEALSKGGLSLGIISTDDCRGTYEALRANGVEFSQEPTEHFYGTDCALRDPFGNALRITEHKLGPIDVPTK